ncbi:MAG TPA: MnmC family methyltransferase [Candidatus Cloacimonadota bacterium]|nr:MnmC family methyltransferase [Candidatus Cloacimonadota bacterium]
MNFIKTQDGSFTAFNEAAGEHYHSISGALEEALQKHVNAIGVENGFRILDFCFGLGYNSIAATRNHQNLEIIGLENDIEIVRAIHDMEVPDSLQTEFDAFRDLSEKIEIKDINNNTIQLIIGDALKTIDVLPNEYFDRVFFDPFSPKKQPEMWSEEIFQKVYEKMKSGGKLSTYSCAKWIRQNMQKAGFIVLDGPVVGRKSPATIGMKTQNM